MSTPPTVHRLSTTEYLSPTGRDEFIVVIDSLGRRWNPLLHPRDRMGRFIRTFSTVNFNLPGSRGAGTSVSGRVSGIDQDGNLLVKVEGVAPGAPPGVKEGDYVKIPHDQVEVQTVKARLGGRGAAGRLNRQETTSMQRGSANLRRLGLNAEADKLDEAMKLATAPVDRRNPAASQASKDRAIELMREVAEAVGEERGKGFDEGTDYEAIKGELTSEERARLQTLDQVMGTTFTARHSLGDKTIDAENDEGPVKAKAGEVRIQTAEQELRKDYQADATVWDATGGTLQETHLEAPVKAEVRDTVSEQQGEQMLPELARSSYQKLQTGLSRLSGWKQAQQVAPGDRFHVDKEGNEVVVGHIVVVDPTKSRAGFTGMVTRIYTDAKGGKHVYARDFDPDGTKGYTKGYKDYSVQGGSIQLADEGEQSAVFQQLAQLGAGDASKALVKSFTDEYLEQMRRRFASPDAKRISPTGGFFDVAPIHNRVRSDSNGESIRIGDHVMGPNGESGVVTYIEPNENTVKVQYPNGQKASRISSRRLTRLHGPSSDVYLRESEYGDNNYIPTRDEAADIADGMGASSVAEAIRGGADASAIQEAMVSDEAFQNALPDAQALFDKRDDTLAAGQELSDEDREALANWDRLAAASAGQFREGSDAPSVPPSAPVPEDEERPGNPANPDEEVDPSGVTVREEDGSVIVDDNAEDPIPVEDESAVEEAIQQAGGEAPEEPEVPETEEEAAPQAVAQRITNDLKGYADEVDYKDNVQRLQVQKHLGVLDEAVAAKDPEAFVAGLRKMTQEMNSGINQNIRNTKLGRVLNGAATNGTPLHEFIQGRVDSGDDIFGAPQAVQRVERPEGAPDETPEGVDPKVDKVDNAVSEALLMDDGSTLVMRGDEPIDDGFYVVDPATVTEYDHEPNTADLTEFLNETQGSDYDGISVWFDEDDGRYRVARVGIFDTEAEAGEAAENSGTNQYVGIADGLVWNIATGGDPDMPPEAVEDPRSEDRAVRTAGAGKSSARTTAKQKKMLEHVAGTGDDEIARITQAVANGEEINGADASRLADYVDGLDAGQFEKPSDKGVASQMAHRLARAAGEEGARGYSSQNTALRRTSDVGISLSALSQDDEIRGLVTDAREDIKNGDNAAAAQKFRDAAEKYDTLGLATDAPSKRAREHADRLEAMGGTTAPAPEAQAPPEQAPQEGRTTRELLDEAGLPEVEPLVQSGFSNPDTPRTRQVTPQEYTAIALRGKDTLNGYLENGSAPDALQGQTWDEVKAQAWDAVQEEWGGITIDAHTGQAVTGDQDAYAITFRPPGTETVSVPIGSSQEEFDAAMETALQQLGGEEDSPLWAENAHLGVFRNDDTGNWEIDPVLVVDNLDDAEAIGAYSGSNGGAYNFKDGLGYWPPYVAEGEAGGGAEEGVPGTRRLEGASPEGGEAEPGVPEEGPGEGGVGPEGAPEAESVADLLGTIDSYLESERQAEGDNGPRGWDNEMDEVNSMLRRIMDRGNDDTLAEDLRELADAIDDTFHLTEPSEISDEIRRFADSLDAGEGAPEAGGAPFPGGPGGAPAGPGI